VIVLRKTQRIVRKPAGEYRGADTVNREGFPAWSKSDHELVRQFLYTNTLENTFYAARAELVPEGLGLLARFDDSEYLAETIVAARNEGFMRTAPLMGLVFLSKKDVGLFREVFPRVVQTGEDMAQFLDLCRRIRGLGRAVKSTIHMWLREKVNEFYAIKYGNELVDAIRLSRPSEKIFGEEGRIIADYLMGNPRVTMEMLPPKIRAFEELKRTPPTDEETILKLVEEGRLDYSVVVGAVKPTPQIWMGLARQMGTFALLRHLATLERNNALDQLADHIKKRLTVDSLVRAKIFPFRLYEAYMQVGSAWVKEHLADLLDGYVSRYDFSSYGRAAVCPDVSGSMTSPVRGAAYTPATIAGMFAGVLYKGIPNSILIPWDNEVRLNLVHPRRDSILTHIRAISEARGGGTSMEKPIQYLLENGETVNTVILITDSQEWGEGWLEYWRKYKERVAPGARAFLLRVDPYGTNPFSADVAERLSIFQIYGWSDNVVKYMDFVLRGGTCD
jgi:60 kDa SS-A/Ro ribonucleoprotein